MILEEALEEEEPAVVRQIYDYVVLQEPTPEILVERMDSLSRRGWDDRGITTNQGHFVALMRRNRS